MTDERVDRGDGRDAKGRWTKNTSGNLNGRPMDVADYDMSDVCTFSEFPTEITIGGEKQLMTRHEIVLFKLFESALKGRITAIKILLEKFEKAQLERESVHLWLDKWGYQLGEDHDSVPPEVVQMMKRALDSHGPRLSTLRSRSGRKPKLKLVRKPDHRLPPDPNP